MLMDCFIDCALECSILINRSSKEYVFFVNLLNSTDPSGNAYIKYRWLSV